MFNIKRVFWGGLLLLMAIAAYLRLTAPLQIELPYGETLILRDVQFGFTNVYTHGSRIEKMLGDLIPATGVRLGRWNLHRPSVQTKISHEFSSMVLYLEVKEPGSYPDRPRLTSLNDAVKFRVLYWGDDGFAQEAEVSRSYLSGDTVYLIVADQNYSRSSKVIHIQLQARESYDKPWEDLQGFEVANPTPVPAGKWPYADYPVTQTNDLLVCRLGDVQVRSLKERTEYADSQPVVQMPFQLIASGNLITNWMLRELSIKDSIGGGVRFQSLGRYTNDWTYYQSFRSANPQAIWKIDATVYIQPARTASNVFTLNLPTGVIESNQIVVAEKTINYWMKNLGPVERLMVSLQTKETNAHLLLLQVKDAQGKDVTDSFTIDNIEASKIIEKAPYLSCFYLPHKLRRSPFSMTFAVVEDTKFEFTVKPRLVKEFTELPPIAE